MICQSTGRLCSRLLLALIPVILSLLVSNHSVAQCSVTSARAGSTFSNNAGVGSFAWSAVGNLILSDNGRANNGILLGILATQNTHYITVQNFGFGIPPGAGICGIEVTIERRATGLLIGSSIRDNSIRLIKNNVISGSNMASGANWPGSDGSHIYGSVSETWGTSWTPEDINAGNFGVAISARLSAGLASLFLTAEIDQVVVRVFYNLILPVQLINFKAIQQENTVDLEWATASENHNNYFVIERSLDGVSGWHSIDSIAGWEKSNALHYYHAKDNDPMPVNFYRVKQTDQDGSKTMSGIVKVQVDKIKKDLQVFPNPIRSNNEMTVLFPGKIKQAVLKNITGKEVAIKNFVALSQGIKLKVPELESGYYWLIIQTAENIYTRKILVFSN
jgi:hypothetical protein